VVVRLLSTDAVQVAAGDPVIISDWGGAIELAGEVLRVDPFGITQFSALGVEEQRVDAVIAFSSPSEDYAGLGHGFRVEAQIIVWEAEDVLIVPASALFRSRDSWAVFVVVDGTASLRTIEIGPNNGIEARVMTGLSERDQVILYPSSGLSEGMRVAERIIN
jgi:HlyD family secretion protein